MTIERPSRAVFARAMATLVVPSVLAGARVASADCAPGAAANAYADAHRAFEDKRYDDSVALLRQAYACDPKPVYLGNIARTYEEANRPREALEAWRAYLAVVGDDRERTVTEGRISVLTKMVDDLDRLEREKQAAEEAQRKAEGEARAALHPPPDPGTPARHGAPAAAWITAAAGAAGLVAGGVLGGIALSQHNAAIAETDDPKAASMQSNARTLAQAANWSFVVGGAIAAVGVTWIGIDLLRPASTTPSARASVVVMGPSVAVLGSF